MTNDISRLMFYQLRFTHWFQQNQWLPWWLWASLVARRVKCLPTMWETQVRSLGREEPLEGNGNPLQYSCLENPMDGGAW